MLRKRRTGRFFRSLSHNPGCGADPGMECGSLSGDRFRNLSHRRSPSNKICTEDTFLKVIMVNEFDHVLVSRFVS